MRPRLPVLIPLIALTLGACIQEQPSPLPGECASGPPGERVWTWGEIRIGTCLSGPADLQFFEQDGRTYLGVTNANPYLDFDTGSFLVVDWASLDLERDQNLMHEVRAGALPIGDYLGGFGVLGDRREAMVTGRESPDDNNRSADDRVWMVDLDRPLNPVLGDTPRLPLRDDPFPVVVDDVAGRAYVGNLTDHSVAVFDTTVDGPIERIDVAPGTVVGIDPFLDADGSGSTAVVQAVDVVAPDELVDDTWTLDWIDGTARLWSPVPAGDEGLRGLQRWTDVGLGPIEAGIPDEFHPDEFGEVLDPTLFEFEAAWMYFVDPEGQNIWRVTSPDLDANGVGGDGPIGDWDPVTAAVQLQAGGAGSWDAVIGGPFVEIVDEFPWMFYDGRTAAGEPASIGFTIQEAPGALANAQAPFLDPAEHDGFLSFEDPTAWHDVSHDAVRVWMTATRDDGTRVIGLTETDDGGESWSEVEVVLEDLAADLVAPVVQRRHGRFEIWYTRDDGLGWTHHTAWSWDGRSWFDDTLLFDSELAYDPLAQAPRLAVQVLDTRAWRIEGRDTGPLPALLTSGTTFVDIDHGISVNVAHGQEFDNAVVPDGRAELGLVPGSLVDLGGIPTLYATAVDDARSRLVVMQQQGDSWVPIDTDLIPANTGGNKAGVADPVVVSDGAGWVMFYAATDGQEITRVRRATSPDGLVWTPEPGDSLVNEDDWDGVEQHPHSVELRNNGGIRLWYAGGNGSRLRIGSATANSPSGALRPEVGAFDPWRFEPGVPGSFDDGGVRDPLVYTDEDGVVHMLYAGFDGQQWALGHAVQQEDGTFERRIDPASDRSLPSMPGEPLSFSAFGARSPVLLSQVGEELELLYAGTDAFVERIGRAVGRPDRQWPAMRVPTVGDQLSFSTTQGRTGTSVIELAQSTETFVSTGIGMAGMTHDPDRGMLYIPSKLESYFYMVDVRDDSGGGLDDANALDLEGVVAVSAIGSIGFRDALVDAARDRLYLTSRNPDGVVVVDLTRLVDDDRKDVDWFAASTVLPLQSQIDDPGATTVASIGGAGMTLSADGRYLLVAHHRGNGVAIFDLEQGAWGQEIAWLADIGENPHRIALSPDGRYAVVANYVGKILDDDSASGTLAVIDMDPESDTFLEVVTWLENR